MITLVFLHLLTQSFTLANHTLYRVTAFNSLERSVLYDLHVKHKYFYFMNDITNNAVLPMDVIVKDCCIQAFEQNLQNNGIQYTQILQEFSLDGNRGFYDWETITTWASRIEKEYAVVTKIVIAKTYEKRDLFILKLSTSKKKFAVFIMSGEDGRDWLTPAIVLKFINYLLEKKDLGYLIKFYDFYFIPFMNPDGYAYSMNANRLWQKNRKKFVTHKLCKGDYSAAGVNLDRNWYFTESPKYVIDQECNAIYIGQKPLSEEETQAVSYALNNLALDLMAFINLKGFGRIMTIPYGNEDISVNHDIVMELITMASNKIREKYNVMYYVGRTAEYIYNSSGNVADWVKKMLNIPIVYTVSLKHEDDILPNSDNIEPLTHQLCTIFNETLIMAKEIYGPLFNCNSQCDIKLVSYIVIIHVLYKCLLKELF